MKRYSLSELVKRWEREELTIEQAIGQILLWMVSFLERVEKLETNHNTAQHQTRVNDV